MVTPKKKIAIAAVLVCLDVLFFGRINPNSSPSLVLFAAFGVLVLNLCIGWYLLLRASRLLISRPRGSLRRPAVVAACVSVVLLALQSIGQLTPRDIIALVASGTLFWLYISYYKRKQVR